MEKMKKIKLLLLGFGNAGQAFAKLLLTKREQIADQFNCEVEVVAIITRSRGSLVDSNGLDLEKACLDIQSTGKFDESCEAFTSISSMDAAKQIDYDILLELTPLEIFTGQPAINHIKVAFERVKDVITANKGPIAWAFKELQETAEKKGCLFFYETTVMDGTPIFNLVQQTLKMCKVTEINGILNTTTNFVLEEMAKGKEYETIITEGKRRGFIEADPAMDIEGWDAAAKVTALLNVLMNANITPKDIDRTGIENITAEDIKAADERGCVIKLICTGSITDGQVNGSVRPMEISKNELFATIDGTSSVVSITTDLMGKLSIVEHAPEIEQTAYGIFSDLLRVLAEL